MYHRTATPTTELEQHQHVPVVVPAEDEELVIVGCIRIIGIRIRNS